ncbi:GntR family transcriptional regulator [Streptomyces sp. NPDC098781]|uniref:GntR family transcriptional regulator n=1 Tax=Streptomyces sp. NPDC098781 TaxID=3366097 RepID=UPI0037FB38CE
MLPAQRVLAQELAVSRDTMQRVLRSMVAEGWIASRQGSGSRVVKAPAAAASPVRGGTVRLEHALPEAFAQPRVVLDVFNLSSESLDVPIRLQLDRIRQGEIAPESVAVRMLLPTPDAPLTYPLVKGHPEDTRARDRVHRIAEPRVQLLREEFSRLGESAPAGSYSFEVRRAALTPSFKLYLINGTEALFSPYTLVERPNVLDDGKEVETLDVQGLGARLHRFTLGDPASSGGAFVEDMQEWFDSVWDLLAR